MNTESADKAHRAPFLSIFFAVALQMGLVLAVCYFISPQTFLAELSQPWMLLAWAVGLGLPFSLFEYLYHRYLLHSAVLPFMAAMHRAHSTHHGLTSVKAPVTPKDPAKLVEVDSEYPVEEEHQEESMRFPYWGLLIFFVIFGITLGLPLKLMFPAQPILLATIVAVTVYYTSYETWHAVLHMPYERFWKPLIESRRIGRVVKRIYSFHLMHHWRPTSNLAVVGLWGFAVWDHLFRTHRRPERLPVDGAEVTYEDAKLAKPLWPISTLDRWQGKLYKASRSIEKFLARIFLKRASG